MCNKNPDVIFEGWKALVQCIKEVKRLNRQERKEYFLIKLRSFQLVVTRTGRYYYAWKIEVGESKLFCACSGFKTAYSISS